MLLSKKQYAITSGSSPYTIDLKEMAEGEDGYVDYLADFCLEMEGNNAAATIKAKGSFSNSTFKSVTDGSFDVNGGMISVSGFAISAIEITTTATLPIYLNVIRQIRNI